MNMAYFEYAPECLAIVDEKAKIIHVNQKFRTFFGAVAFEGNLLSNIKFCNKNGENLFEGNKILAYLNYPCENREIQYATPEGYRFYFLLSCNTIKLDEEKYIYFSFKHVTDFVSYKNIFEELYNNLSSKTIELDNVLREKEAAYKMLKQKDTEMLHQLTLAQDIQRRLFPEINKTFSGYEIATKIQPATMISGDMVFFYEKDKNHIDIIVADVTGHGIPAALITMLLRMSLQTTMHTVNTPLSVLQQLNKDMYSILSNSTIFATILYCQIDTFTDNVKICNCGHPPPILIKGNRNGKVERKKSGGIMLGVEEELDYDFDEFHLEKDDILCFITDGVTEATNKEGDFFEETLYRSLQEIGQKKPKPPLNEVILHLLTKLNEHTKTSELQDDVTIVCVTQNKTSPYPFYEKE